MIGFLGILWADWYLYTVIGVFLTAIVVAGYWWYYSRIKIGYKAVFTKLLHGVVRNEGGKDVVLGGVRKVLGEKEFRADQKEIKWGKSKEPFKVDMTKPAYQWYGWTRYYYDVDEGDQLTFGGVYQSLRPNDADEFINDGLIHKMLHSLPKPPLELILIVVVMAVMAAITFVVGLFVSPYILPPQNSTRQFVVTGAAVLGVLR